MSAALRKKDATFATCIDSLPRTKLTIVSDTSGPTHNRQNLIVIGAGMATHALLRRLDSLGGLEHYQVTVIGEEPYAPYDRVHLTSCFSGASPDELLLSPRAWYDDRVIQLVTGARVTRLDRNGRYVETDDRRRLAYDLVVLATGSAPFVPSIDGVDLPGVFLYRTIEDIGAIQQYADGRASAAVLGGGLLGLEAAKALHDLNLRAHVIEVAPGLMPRQLNAEAATLLREEIESLGVEVHLPRRANGITAVGERRVVQFAGHDPLAVDMVVISAGIRPRDELAREAGLACGARGGMAVDGLLRTDDPRVYAIGECASLDNQLFGLVGPCYDMAETLAENLVAQAAGEKATSRFQGASLASRLKLMGVDVSTLGLPIGEAAGGSVIVSRGEGYCRSLIVDGSRIVGAIGVGPWPERERLSGAIADRKRMSSRQLRRFKETGQVWSDAQGASVLEWSASATVCSCLNVTRGELTDALQSGAKSTEDLARMTGASTVCGSCKNLLCELAGQPQVATGSKGRSGLLGASLFAALVTPTILAIEPDRFADSVQSTWRSVDVLWQDSFVKQVTGFTLLGISLFALLLSIRKRVSWFRLGDFNLWRGIHGLLGAATLFGFLVHTGMKLGHNFTFVLALTFLLLNLLGAFTGVTASLESRFTGVWGQRLRAWRPRLTSLHIWLFWPIPALVLFHVISVYYY